VAKSGGSSPKYSNTRCATETSSNRIWLSLTIRSCWYRKNTVFWRTSASMTCKTHSFCLCCSSGNQIKMKHKHVGVRPVLRILAPKTTGSHLALRVRNSSVASGRELCKGSKDMASLLVDTRKKLYGWDVPIFCEWCHKWVTFRPPWPTSPGPGLKLLDGSISLKFWLETRLQSESFDTLDDLMGFQVQKLWSKVMKIFDYLGN